MIKILKYCRVTFDFTGNAADARNKAFCSSHKSTWRRIEGSSFCKRIIVWSFWILRKINLISEEIVIQRFHCYVKVSAAIFVKLTALCITRRNCSNLEFSIFRMIMADKLNSMSHWTVTLCKIFYKIWFVSFDIADEGRTRLRNHKLRIILFHLFNISFCCKLGSKRNIKYGFYTN